MKSLAKRSLFVIILIVTVLCSCLIITELGLRFYRWKIVNENFQNRHFEDIDSTIIISLGESTTYGLWVDKAKNYSALLEKKLHKTHEELNVRVINLGFCGAISDDIVDCFYDAIQHYKPSVVLACMGVNDYSYMLNYKKLGFQKKDSHPFTIEKDIIRPNFSEGLISLKFLKKLFVYSEKSYEIDNWVTVENREGDSFVNYYNPSEKKRNFDQDSIVEITKNLEFNYKLISDSCRDLGANFYVVGYLNERDSRLQKEIADKHGIHFVDNVVSKQKLRKYTLHDLFHPNVNGHRLIRNNIFKKLRKTWPILISKNP